MVLSYNVHKMVNQNRKRDDTQRDTPRAYSHTHDDTEDPFGLTRTLVRYMSFRLSQQLTTNQ